MFILFNPDASFPRFIPTISISYVGAQALKVFYYYTPCAPNQKQNLFL